MCEHATLEIDARAIGEGASRYLSVQVRCPACKTRFAFPGVGLGPMHAGPTVSISRLELVTPIEPDGHMTSLLASVGAPWEARNGSA